MPCHDGTHLKWMNSINEVLIYAYTYVCVYIYIIFNLLDCLIICFWTDTHIAPISHSILLLGNAIPYRWDCEPWLYSYRSDFSMGFFPPLIAIFDHKLGKKLFGFPVFCFLMGCRGDLRDDWVFLSVAIFRARFVKESEIALHDLPKLTN